MEPILNYFIFFGGPFYFLMGIGQFFIRSFIMKDVILGCLFFIMAMMQFQHYYTVAYLEAPILAGSQPLQFAKFLVAPILFFYYRRAFQNDASFHLLDIFHLLPALGSILLQIIVFLNCPTFPNYEDTICGFISSSKITIWYNWSVPVLILGYLIYIFIKLGIISLIMKRMNDRNTIILTILIAFMLVILFLLTLGTLLESVFLTRIALAGLTLIVVLWYLLNIRYPDLGYAIEEKIKKTKQIKSVAKHIDPLTLTNRIEEFMHKEKLFLDENLTVQKLANRLSIPNHQLSNIISNEYKKNFNSFINTYRINEAIEVLKKTPTCDLLNLAYSVGFNSKSTFYEAFKKETGTTPGKYRSSLKS